MPDAPPAPARILIVDDDESVALLASSLLKAPDRVVEVVHTGAAALEALKAMPWDVALLDIFLPDMDGLDVMRRAKALDPRLVVLVMSGHGDIDLAVRAMKEDAFDFIRKPFESNQSLKQIVQWALDYRRSKSVHVRRGGTDAYPGDDEFIAGSASMQLLLDRLRKLAASGATVLLEGESGTGKELLARYIHRHSPRAKSPFVTADCGALSPSLVESELFGHVRGAFTGADAAAPGLARSANGGTLFLDEISDLPLEMQSKFLRLLQEREVRPVGDVKATAVDVRIVAATNRDLEAMVAAGKFRLDLLYRLNTAVCQIPPLRERREEIPQLLQYFIQKHAEPGATVPLTFNPWAMQRLKSHGWPGNVRELENLVLQILAIKRSGAVGLSDLPAKFRTSTPPVQEFSGSPKTVRPALSLEAYEKAAVERALRETGHDIEAAAKLLNIATSSMYRKMKEFGIKRAKDE